MASTFTAAVTITINADASAVWKALTDPAMIKQYLFGTQTDTDWKQGSPIYFRGEWQGTTYEDKGTILDNQPGRLISYTYWSSMSGTPDIPENYAVVTYELEQRQDGVALTIRQRGIRSEESRKHSEQNWGSVLNAIKILIEKK
ncbi:MAG: SRPBCC family protein [Bacteriovoracaceae bacterium]